MTCAFIDKVGAEKVFSMAQKAGLEAIDLGLMGGYNVELSIMKASDKEIEEYFTNLKKVADKYGIEVGQTHAFFPSEYDSEEKFNWLLDQFEKNIKATALVGCKYIVIHPANYRPDEYGTERINDKTYRLYKALIPVLEKYDVYNAVENMWMSRDGVIMETGISNAREILKCIKEVGSDRFVTCLDSGHMLNVGRNLGDEARKLGKTLKIVHLHDNRWMRDSHEIPLFGETDWKDLMLALKEIEYDGNFNVEGSSGKFYNIGGEELLYEFLTLVVKASKICISLMQGEK
jgi:sugar phosphate isomerase/epimerase